MNEAEGPGPTGSAEASSTPVGEPERVQPGERGPRDEERPDLDEREERIATRRKPPGPPLREPGPGTRDVPAAEEPPVDPDEPEEG